MTREKTHAGDVVVDMTKGAEKAIHDAVQNFMALLHNGMRQSGDDPQIAAEAMLTTGARALRGMGLSSLDVQMILDMELKRYDLSLPSAGTVRH